MAAYFQPGNVAYTSSCVIHVTYSHGACNCPTTYSGPCPYQRTYSAPDYREDLEAFKKQVTREMRKQRLHALSIKEGHRPNVRRPRVIDRPPPRNELRMRHHTAMPRRIT